MVFRWIRRFRGFHGIVSILVIVCAVTLATPALASGNGIITWIFGGDSKPTPTDQTQGQGGVGGLHFEFGAADIIVAALKPAADQLMPMAISWLAAFATIQMIITHFGVLKSGGDIEQLFAKLIGSLAWITFCIYVLNNGSGFLERVGIGIFNSFLGNWPGQTAILATISGIIGVLLIALAALWNGFSFLGNALSFPGLGMCVLVLIFVILFITLMVVAEVVMLKIEIGLIVLLAPLSFSFLGLNALKDQGIAPFKSMLALVYRMILLGIVLSGFNNILDAYWSKVKGLRWGLDSIGDVGSNVASLFSIVIALPILFVLLLKSKSIATSLASGTASLGAGDITSAAAAGAAAGAAAAGGAGALAASKPAQSMSAVLSNMMGGGGATVKSAGGGTSALKPDNKTSKAAGGGSNDGGASNSLAGGGNQSQASGASGEGGSQAGGAKDSAPPVPESGVTEGAGGSRAENGVILKSDGAGFLLSPSASSVEATASSVGGGGRLQQPRPAVAGASGGGNASSRQSVRSAGGSAGTGARAPDSAPAPMPSMSGKTGGTGTTTDTIPSANGAMLSSLGAGQAGDGGKAAVMEGARSGALGAGASDTAADSAASVAGNGGDATAIRNAVMNTGGTPKQADAAVAGAAQARAEVMAGMPPSGASSSPDVAALKPAQATPAGSGATAGVEGEAAGAARPSVQEQTLQTLQNLDKTLAGMNAPKGRSLGDDLKELGRHVDKEDSTTGVSISTHHAD